MLGGLGPRSDLAEREETIAALQEELDERPRAGWRSPVPGLDRILREPEVEDGNEGNAEDQEPIAGPTDAGTGAPRWRERLSDRLQNTTAGERYSAFERIVSVQNVRRVQSRAALAEQAELTDEELGRVDEVLLEMNQELVAHGEELIFLTMDGEAPARDLLGITHDVTGILHRSQVQLEEILGGERAADVEPSALEVWNHVDLGRLEPAARAAAERLP